VAFDEALAQRVRSRLAGQRGITEKRMFGGLAFLLNGNMCCGVHRQSLIVRLQPAHTELALSQPHARIFDLSGRPMKGWLLVDGAGLHDHEVLARWLGVAVDYARSLPRK
jgi:TfoX/Sxy family transcriptional regulator of competence genes